METTESEDTYLLIDVHEDAILLVEQVDRYDVTRLAHIPAERREEWSDQEA
jgi:hypothetical protein